jgi:hypothetical protein
MIRAALTLVLALATACVASADPSVPMPAIAGGSCGLLRELPMPTVNASLYYWRCADGREVFFHVRKGWTSGTQSADNPSALRAELIGLRARALAERVDQNMSNAISIALGQARAQTV